MVKEFIVSKNFMDFELLVDGTIEVKPLPSKEFRKETITLLADVHKTLIDFYRIRGSRNDLVEIAVRYFERKGFEVKEKSEILNSAGDALDVFRTKAIVTQLEQSKKKFIVAIGASAGGLKPLQAFFDSTPNDHATYIILTHLLPAYKSILGDILKKHSKLEIYQAEDGIVIEQNKVYMLPSDTYMTIEGDRLYLQPRSNFRSYPNEAIDVFFESLAEEKGAESIAVILSGCGSDGAKGAKIIKDKGGMVIVQKPHSSDFSYMAKSVIKNGVADYQLLPEEMPKTILNHINKWINDNGDK